MTDIVQYQLLSDAEVIEEILGGKIALYEVIMRRYNAYLYRIGRSNGFHHEDTEDLMQDTYLQAYRSLRNFEHRSSFKTWLVKIFIHQGYQFRHKASHQRETATDLFTMDTYQPMFTSKAMLPDQASINKELHRRMETAIQGLPEEYREVFTLRELGGMSTAETADTMAITEANVKVRLNRAKAMLRTELARMYTVEELFEFNLVYCDRLVANVMDRIQAMQLPLADQMVEQN